MTSRWRPAPPPDGALNFEPTDFSEARRALDALPEGLTVARNARSGNWEGRRRPKVATDRALVGTTMDWLLRLPAEARPVRLVDTAPRIANALASVWYDRSKAVAFLEDLFVDRRGGRRGLPSEIRQELDVLYRLLTMETTEPGTLTGA